MFLVDGQWIFRFPRRAVALPGLRREIDVLPLLALAEYAADTVRDGLLAEALAGMERAVAD